MTKPLVPQFDLIQPCTSTWQFKIWNNAIAIKCSNSSHHMDTLFIENKTLFLRELYHKVCITYLNYAQKISFNPSTYRTSSKIGNLGISTVPLSKTYDLLPSQKVANLFFPSLSSLKRYLLSVICLEQPLSRHYKHESRTFKAVWTTRHTCETH